MARRSQNEIHPAYLIILLILCLASLLSCLWFFAEKTKAYQEFSQKINWLSQENETLSLKMDASEKEKLNLAGQLKEIQEQLKEFTVAKAGFSSKLDSLVKENQNLTSQIKNLSREKLVLGKKIKDLQSDTLLSDLVKQKTSLEIQLKELKQNLSAAGPNLQDISSGQSDFQAKLNEIVQAKVKMEEVLNSERQLSQSLSNQLLEERKERLLARAEKETIQRKMEESQKLQDSLQIQLSRATTDLEMVKKEKESLGRQLALLNHNALSKPKELEAMNSALDNMPGSSIPSIVELPPVIVRADSKIEWAAPKTQGDIISVDKEHNFVVINLGEDDAVKLGQVFKINQEGQDIAQIRVIQTRKSIAACDIKELKPGYEIKKDDAVILVQEGNNTYEKN